MKRNVCSGGNMREAKSDVVHFDKLHFDFIAALVGLLAVLRNHCKQLGGCHGHDTVRAAFAEHSKRFAAGVKVGVHNVGWVLMNKEDVLLY